MKYVSFVLHLNVHCSVFFLHSWFTVYIALVGDTEYTYLGMVLYQFIVREYSV